MSAVWTVGCHCLHINMVFIGGGSSNETHCTILPIEHGIQINDSSDCGHFFTVHYLMFFFNLVHNLGGNCLFYNTLQCCSQSTTHLKIDQVVPRPFKQRHLLACIYCRTTNTQLWRSYSFSSEFYCMLFKHFNSLNTLNLNEKEKKYQKYPHKLSFQVQCNMHHFFYRDQRDCDTFKFKFNNIPSIELVYWRYSDIRVYLVISNKTTINNFKIYIFITPAKTHHSTKLNILFKKLKFNK